MKYTKNNPVKHVDLVNGNPSSLNFNWSQGMLDIHIDNLINTWGHRIFVSAVKLNLENRKTISALEAHNKTKVGSK